MQVNHTLDTRFTTHLEAWQTSVVRGIQVKSLFKLKLGSTPPTVSSEPEEPSFKPKIGEDNAPSEIRVWNVGLAPNCDIDSNARPITPSATNPGLLKAVSPTAAPSVWVFAYDETCECSVGK